jgi:GntR family transcriptional repressor for pyruvate dehydrogenase complex
MEKVKLSNDTSIVQKIVDRIKEALIYGDLKPGDKLPAENILIDKFSVSRTAVREAIKMLAAIGVVEIKRGSGTFVAKSLSSHTLEPLTFTLILNQKTPQELLELREMLELGVIGIAMENATSEDINEMELAIESLESKVDFENVEELCQADLYFHYLFAQATHNPLIEKMARTVWDMFVPSIMRSLRQGRTKIKVKEAVREHKMILKAVKEKNVAEGMEAIRASLRAWKKDRYKIGGWT